MSKEVTRALGVLLGISAACAFAEEPRTLGKIVVDSAEEEIGVISPRNSASSKTDIALIETPLAISVVTAKTIEERGITRLADALTSVAGVSRSSTYGYYDAYTIRGYDAAYSSLFLDGLTTASTNGTNNELVGLERVEVVKGAASALYGATPLGGIVNLVSKRPRAERFIQGGIASGSYNLIEGTLDANAPLNSSESLLGRVTVLYRDSDDFVDYAGENRLFVAPALTWNIGDATSLTLLGRYQRDRDNPWSPYIAYGTVLPSAHGELPIDFAVNRPGAENTVQRQDREQIGYAFDHAFTDSLKISQNLRYGHSEIYWNNWLFSDDILDNNVVDGVQQGHVLGMDLYGPYTQVDNDFGVDTRLHYELATGVVTHDFMVGVDFKRNGSRSSDEGGNFDTSVNTYDILAPDYSTPLIHDAVWAYSDSSKSEATGYYLQDHLGFGERLFVTLGGRWDQVNIDDVPDEAFSPNVGVNYLVTPDIGLYANAARSFTPQFGWVTDVDGNSLPAESGRNFEVGVKLGDASQAFNAQLAAFQLTRRNVATEDPENPFFYVVTGEQRSRGLEFEGGWSPAPAWKLSWAYTLIDAVITSDSVFPTGVQLSNIPKHNVYLYGTYDVPDGPLARLSVSVGALYNSDKNSALATFDYDGDGIDDPAIPLPAYTVLDAVLAYPFGAWQAQLAVGNLLDERFYPDAGYYTRVTPGEPRNVRVSVSVRF